MKYFELLLMNGTFVQTLRKNGVVLTDADLMPIYAKYLQMRRDGEKKYYIMEKLASEAGVTSRTLYSVFKRMETDVVF